MRTWADLYTNRQLTALTTFSDWFVKRASESLADSGDPDYADAVATYLALASSRSWPILTVHARRLVGAVEKEQVRTSSPAKPYL